MAAAVAGTTLVAGGAAALNQVYERDTDALMRRTRMRPLPDGRVSAFGCPDVRPASVGGGPRAARALVNLLATALALATLVIYLIVYTPMKRRSSLATLVGAVPGRASPAHRLGGVARRPQRRRRRVVPDRVSLADSALHGHRVAVPGRLRQGRLSDAAGHRARRPPHGTAGRGVCSRARAGQPDSDVDRFERYRLCGRARSCWAPRCSWLAIRFAATRSDRSARWLFFSSITYLPLIWIVMMADKL